MRGVHSSCFSAKPSLRRQNGNTNRLIEPIQIWMVHSDAATAFASFDPWSSRPTATGTYVDVGAYIHPSTLGKALYQLPAIYGHCELLHRHTSLLIHFLPTSSSVPSLHQ
jgi:hypothetical protein